MKSKQKEKNCHVCGEKGKLTFEHVPPRKAFNDKKAFFYTGEQLIKSIKAPIFPWKFDGLRYTPSQRGIGGYTLCGKCNNLTGHWYANAFIDFIHFGYKEILDFGYNNLKENQIHNFTFKDIYPLKIVKQVITMFCSINSPSLAHTHPDLREFVLNREKKGLDPNKYILNIYVGKGEIARNIGLSGVLNTKTGTSRILSELASPPFGFTLDFNPKIAMKNTSCDILFFANDFNYTEKKDISLRIPVLETNTKYPGDYRNRKEVLITYLKNKLAKRIKNISSTE